MNIKHIHSSKVVIIKLNRITKIQKKVLNLKLTNKNTITS